jgi:uncharacterized protein
MRKIILATCLALTSSAFAQADSDVLTPKKLVYVAKLGEAEISREIVNIGPRGWTSKGKFDVLGTRSGSFDAKYTRRQGKGYDYVVAWDTGGRTPTVIAAFDGETFEIGVKGKKFKKTTKVKGKGPRFWYDDLIWASMINAGRAIAAQDAASTLKPNSPMTALMGGSGTEISVTHIASVVTKQTIKGHLATIRVSRIMLSTVGFTLVCTEAGLPFKIEVPSQKIIVEAIGYDGLVGEDTTPKTIVDSGPWRAKLSPPTHEITTGKKVMIPMRDGVRLAADIYRPQGEGKFPTILGRTPYTRNTEGALKGAYYARRGYVYIAQDVRGRFDSEGEWFPFIHEVKDGSDTLDWIAKQKWSDGKVGMVGASYVGLVQWLAAKSGNKHLRCIVPQVSPPDPQENFPYEGGAFLMGAAWWARVLDTMKHGTSWASGLDFEKAYKTLPLGALDDAMGLKEETFLDTWLSHPPHDTTFWGPAMYQSSFGEIDIPVFHISGWFDGDMPGAIQNFPGMRRRAKTAKARAAQYLVMGPWTHFFNSARKIGKVDFGDQAVIDLDSRILRFFDRYLKDIQNGIDEEPPVHVFTMGSNTWHAEADFPLPQTKFTKIYLSSDGNARKRDGDGKLALTPPTNGATTDTYVYDPKKLPELDVDFTDTSGAYATQDKNSIPDREDDLEYTSPPFATACEVIGPIRVVLFASTDAEDTDFAATLYRITKGGKRFGIWGGIQRLRYAKDPLRDQPVAPGEVTRVEVDCWATGLRFEKGDRLQVEVSSWSWPGYARNLNTLEPQFTATKPVVARNTIHHDAKRPSHVLLPVIPRSDAPGIRFESK